MTVDKKITDTVRKINDLLTSQLWMDFEYSDFDGYELTITGSIDLTYKRSFIVITFRDINFTCINDSWHTDTSRDVLLIPDENEREQLSRQHSIYDDYILFKFLAEDQPGGIYIAAKEIEFKTDGRAVKAPKA